MTIEFGGVKTILYGRAQRVSKLLFLARENETEKAGMTSSISSPGDLRN